MTAKLSALLKQLIDLLSLLAKALSGKNKKPDCACPPPLKAPDPFLYSQAYLMSRGEPVTWDNPDIYLFHGKTLVDPHMLQADTTYTVVARVWNNSYTTPAVNMLIDFSYLSFGIATQSHPIGSAVRNLGAKGLPGCPVFAHVSWTTPAVFGHYCIQVRLQPADDSNWLNNLGQRNIHVTKPQSPAIVEFSVGNHDTPRARTIGFTVDSYAIPPLRACDDRASADTETATAVSPHAPVPEGWTVAIAPNPLRIEAGAEQRVSATITPPPGFTGAVPFNITARDKSGPLGGVTVRVEAP